MIFGHPPFPWPRRPLERLAFAVLAWIGRRIGYPVPLNAPGDPGGGA